MNPDLYAYGQDAVGARSSSSDWSGVFKIAALVGAGVTGYLIYRHLVVIGSTAKGTLSALAKKEGTS